MVCFFIYNNNNIITSKDINIIINIYIVSYIIVICNVYNNVLKISFIITHIKNYYITITLKLYNIYILYTRARA